MACKVSVELLEWIVGDNEVVPIEVGEPVKVGIGLINANEFKRAPQGVDPGIEQRVAEGSGRELTRARSTLVGRLRLIRSSSGSPLIAALYVEELVVLLMDLDDEYLREEVDGALVTVSGNLVIEPYLWGEDGVIHAAAPEGVAPWRVNRIRMVEPESQISGEDASGSGPSALRDVSRVYGAGSPDPAVNYLIDLEYVGASRPGYGSRS